MACFLVVGAPLVANLSIETAPKKCLTLPRTTPRRLLGGRQKQASNSSPVCSASGEAARTPKKATSSRSFSRRSLFQLLALGLSLPAADAAARVVVADPDAGSRVVTTPSGLKYYDFVTAVKDGAATASVGDTVSIEYTLGSTGARNGWLIEPSTDHPPLTFTVGDTADNLVRGLHEGVVGMRVASRRRLLVPANLGYLRPNDQPVPKGFAEYQRFKNIYLNPDRPYKPDLVFDVTLLRVN